jgi:anti-sigma B factor antagonist
VPLTTSVLYDDGVALLALDGDLDLSVSSRVDEAVAALLADRMRLVVVDLAGVSFCDSTGLAALLRASRAIRAARGTCLVAGARGAVHRLLTLTSMERALTLVVDVQPALLALRRAASEQPAD